MKYPQRIILGLLFISGFAAIGKGQIAVSMGPEFQIYPTGAIPGVFLNFHIGDHWAVVARVGYNVVYHGDAGVHDDERGGGFGCTLGYQYDFEGKRAGWFGEIRSDIWFNEIDWEDRLGDLVVEEGTTNVTVVQPTVRIGYRIPFTGQRLEIIPSVSFGVEINVKTDGAAVGQGAILLLGASLGIPIGN